MSLDRARRHTAPFNVAESSLHRKRTISATRSGGVIFASGLAARLAGVSIIVGAMTLQRTPSSACSLATARANAITAAFEAA